MAASFPTLITKYLFLRGSWFGFYTIINIQNSLQTQICAEEMQLWVWCHLLLTTLLCSYFVLLKMFINCLLFAFPVHLVDIWNVIEAFRENGLNTMDLNAELSVARLEVVLSTIFYQLNKRMPTTHQINVEQSISLLLNFLLAAYDSWVTRHVTVGNCFCILISEVLTWEKLVWNVSFKRLPKTSKITDYMP